MNGPRLASAWHAARTVPARARHGRPGRITARAAAAAAASTAAAAVTPGTPAAPAIQTAVLIWAALTSTPELAPPAPGTPAYAAPPTLVFNAQVSAVNDNAKRLNSNVHPRSCLTRIGTRLRHSEHDPSPQQEKRR
jgi:hypothetical protein